MSEAAGRPQDPQTVNEPAQLLATSGNAFTDSITRLACQLPELDDLDDYIVKAQDLMQMNPDNALLPELKQILAVKKNQMQNIINRNAQDLILVLNEKVVREQKKKELDAEIKRNKADLWVEETRQKKQTRIEELRNQIKSAEDALNINNIELRQLVEVIEKFVNFRIKYNDDIVMPWERTENNEIKRDPKYNPHTCPSCKSTDTIIQDQIRDRLTLKCQECQKVWKV